DGADARVPSESGQPTLTYWSVFFSFGLCIAFLGPTLLDLRCQTRSSLPEISWVFFSQQFCLLLGSALGASSTGPNSHTATGGVTACVNCRLLEGLPVWSLTPSHSTPQPALLPVKKKSNFKTLFFFPRGRF
uniref:Uncharacterized protein n=1 Tax=Bos mutus grunniens TaxID=30521 RepID=A0A8B9XIB1_BOSMU